MTKAEVHAGPGAPAVGWSGGRALTIDRAADAGGMGLGYNGGELLLLALGACYTNDVYREAAKLGIAVRQVHVLVEADWGGDPVRARDVRYHVRVEADAEPARIEALIRHVDRVAEIHGSLRTGTPVALAGVEAVTSPR